MYQVESTSQTLRARLRGARGAALPGTVYALGATSFLTDVASEMVTSVLPIYLIAVLALSPLQLGLVDGLQQGVAAIVRLAGGVLADRWRRHKDVAVAGYALSALSRLGLLFAGASPGGIAASVAADRIGKGVRTAPRDALIARGVAPERLGTAFGVHRAFDTAGAMLGPLLAFALLAWLPGAFDALFVASFCIAVIGVAVIVLFVPRSAAAAAPGPQAGDAAPPAAAPPAPRPTIAATLAVPGFGRIVAVAALLSVTTFGEGLLFVALHQRLALDVGMFPLLFVVVAFVFMALAVPVGVLADRVGRPRVFLAGHAALAASYAMAIAPLGDGVAVVGSLLLLGAYFAATDGVLAAMTVRVLEPRMQATGLAIVGTAVGVGRLCASVAFGALWSAWALAPAVGAFVVALLLALVAGARLLAGETRHD